MSGAVCHDGTAFEQRFRTWLLEDYHRRVHSETGYLPRDRWETVGFVPRMPASMEQLDLLLLMVARTRRVQKDGIHFQNPGYKPYLPEPLITFTGRSAVDGLYPYRPFTFASAP